MELISIGRYLTVQTIKDMSHAIQTLNGMLQTIKIESIDFEPFDVTYGISPADIMYQFNIIENNITAIHNRLEGKIYGWSDKYYKPFVWNENVYDIKQQAERWVGWINDVYKMLSSAEIEYMPLNHGSKAVFTKDGKRLHYIRKIYKESE